MDKVVRKQTTFDKRSEENISFWRRLIPNFLMDAFLRFDRRVDGAASFFVKHYGKSRFMVAMSKKSQYLGIEKLWYKGPKAFIYFFLFYLVRDTILYIIIPIFFAKMTS
jgi:hypothetical protein